MPVNSRGMFLECEELAREFYKENYPEKKEQIEKPWAVYRLAPLIIQIVRDTKQGLSVRESETQPPLMFLSHDNFQRFDTSYEAIEYFSKTYRDYREKVIPKFLSNFPSERNNLEKFLAQSQPKFTNTIIHTAEGDLGMKED